MSEQEDIETADKYPLMLFPNGGDPHGQYAIADDAGQEAALRKDGYKTLAESKRHPDVAEEPKAEKPKAGGKNAEG